MVVTLALTAFFFLMPLWQSGGAAFASNQYSITNMQPQGISHYAVPNRGVSREYLHFENELGSHRFIYEEAREAAPLTGISGLRQVMGNTEMACKIDLSCQSKAFCSNKCRSMYYELSNTPNDPQLKDRSNCVITAFKCQKNPGASQ